MSAPLIWSLPPRPSIQFFAPLGPLMLSAASVPKKGTCAATAAKFQLVPSAKTMFSIRPPLAFPEKYPVIVTESPLPKFKVKLLPLRASCVFNTKMPAPSFNVSVPSFVFSVIVSEPSPTLNKYWSLPAPPIRRSLPWPPVIKLFAAFPFKVLAELSPMISMRPPPKE